MLPRDPGDGPASYRTSSPTISRLSRPHPRPSYDEDRPAGARHQPGCLALPWAVWLAAHHNGSLRRGADVGLATTAPSSACISELAAEGPRASHETPLRPATSSPSPGHRRHHDRPESLVDLEDPASPPTHHGRRPGDLYDDWHPTPRPWRSRQRREGHSAPGQRPPGPQELIGNVSLKVTPASVPTPGKFRAEANSPWRSLNRCAAGLRADRRQAAGRHQVDGVSASPWSA